MLRTPHDDVGHPEDNPITQMIWANTLIMGLLAVPSLTLMVLLRRKLGFRTLAPWMVMLAWVAMGAVTLLSVFVAPFSGAGAFSLGFILMTPFELLIIAMAIHWRFRAWQSIKRGERWHTKSRGISYLGFLPLPQHVIQRFVEPILCMALGALLFKIATAVSLWLLFSGLALFVMESLIAEIQLNLMLDQLDGMVESEVAAQNAAFFSGQSTDPEPPSIESMEGISVGLAPELQALVERRKAENASRPADAFNSATTTTLP